jgi:hypothetical protein
MQFAHFKFDPNTDWAKACWLVHRVRPASSVNPRAGRIRQRSRVEIDPGCRPPLPCARRSTSSTSPRDRTIYGQKDQGTSFIAMEYRRAARSTRSSAPQTLGYEECLRIALQVRHPRLSRQFRPSRPKPANIMVQDDGTR